MVANMNTKKDNHKVYSNSQLDGMEALNETIDSYSMRAPIIIERVPW